MSTQLKVATGIKTGSTASPNLAASAVEMALEKAELSSASNVLLLLTSEFANAPQLAIKAAAKAASTTQIMGCSATGIFTEQEWVVDGAAAAAMVFSEDIFSSQPQAMKQSEYLLTLTAPNALNTQWLHSSQKRFGAVSGDATGHGPFSVWQNGKGVTQGYCELGVSNANMAIGVSHGVKLIASPRRITKQQGFDLLSLANTAALTSLKRAYQCHVDPNNTSKEDPPYHRIMIAYANTAKSLEEGRFLLSAVIVTDEQSLTVTLSQALPEGAWASWAIREPESAKQDIANQAKQLELALEQNPTFSLMFSCIGRGPYFYNGDEQDLKAMKKQFPRLPIIGFYGNGEIAPVLGNNTLLQYSAVLALFGHKE